MLNRKKTTRNYATISFFIVIIFLMSPMMSNPGDQIQASMNPEFSVNDGMNLAASTQDFVDSSSSDVDSSPDIGTHSSFASQQAGPDSTYDTLSEANGAPPPTNSEDDIDSDTSDVDSTADVGIEGTFANAQGSVIDSSYFSLQEESVISPYGGETGGVFVTGSVPDMAGNDQYAFYQAIFWNPTDDVYQVSRVEFSYTGSTWLKAIAQGSGSSSPTSGWTLTSGQVAAWTSGTPITVQPHTASSFYVRGDSNKVRSSFYIDIGITANSSTYTETYASGQSNRDRPAAQLWLGSTLPPTQIHSVAASTTTRVYVSLEEDDGGISILTGGTLTIDVPSGFTGITSIGGTNWGTATINGYQITVSNTAAVIGSYITYAFDITSPSTPGLYKLDIAFDDGSNAHPVGNFTIHVTGVPPSVEKVNVEYQWSSATFGETYEEVCIYVGGHTGTENLAVNYWDGFTWNVLGTITSASIWTNFTATGLSSSTYTIQFVGTSESSDSSKDTWNIDLITLHTWSLQTYNYKLDLEIQWSSVNYSQDYEELCIFAGTLASESIRVDIWNGADWTNIATDLTADSWNNITIGTWLTSATLTVRFRGDLEVGDTTQSSWDIDCSLLHTWDNEVPQNTAAPTISNLDNTTFLYAEYRQYQLTADVSDGDGYSAIDYLEVTLTSDDRGTEYWTIRYDEDTNTFTEQADPSDYITLDAGSSSATESGNTISAIFFITINWNHPDVAGTDVKSEVFDANPSSDLDYFEVNWDVETRLDFSSGPTLDDGSGTINRGDLDGSMTASGTITYLGSSLHPSASDIDVWISSSEYGSQTGPWEATNYEDATGTFSATVYADDVVGLDTFTFKAVEEGTGASGSDHFSSGQTSQYIADVVQVQSYSSDDSRINANSSASLHAVLYYDYDNSFVTDGTVTINGITATYSGSDGIWDFTDEQLTAQLVTYDTLVYTGGAHGISGEDQNGQSLNQIWDHITVSLYSAIDARVDVNADATIDVTLVYEYDGSFVVDGTVTVNGVAATHQGSGVWRFTDNKATVQIFTFNLVAASGNTNEITLINQNSQSQEIIWDRVIVTGYTIGDTRVNVDDTVNLDVSLEYEYDNATVSDGSVTINLVAASNIGGGNWRISVSKSSVQLVTYDSIVCSGNAFGITVVNQNTHSQDIIWDQIIVISYSYSDDRVSLDDSVNIDVTIKYEYDNTNVTAGSVSINVISALHQGGGVWRISDSKSSVQSFTYDTITCSGNSYSITSINQNSQSTSVIWDQITVRSYTVLDSHVNLDDLVNVDVLLEYEYDDTPVTDATVSINVLSATHQGSGIWRITVSKPTVQLFTYDTVVCSDNTYGVSSVNQNGQSQDVIWDQIVVRSYSVSDSRTNISSSVDISFTIEYEYDNSAVTNGVVTLNGFAAAHLGAGVWEITQSRGTVQNVTYNNVQCSGNLHGINNVNQNSQSQDVIWDQITVRGYEVIDPRDDVGDFITVTVELEYEYDDSDVTDGTITINSVSYTYTGSLGKWSASRMSAIVTDETYDTVVSSGNTYGITDVNQNGQSQTIIWDRIQVVTTTVDDGRINTDTSCEIRVTLMLEYDSTPLGTGDTVTLDGVAMVWDGTNSWFELSRQQSIVGDWLYYVNASMETTYGISALNLNSQEVTVIWDQIRILTTTVDDGRVSVDSSAELRVTAELAYDGHLLEIGDTVTLDGVAMVWDGTNSWFELSRQQSIVGDWLYYVNASMETTYGISALNLNSQEVTVIWDQIRILTTTVDDGRVSVDSSAELWVTAERAYDNTSLGSGDTIILDGVAMVWDGTDLRFELSRVKSSVGLWNFQVESASDATYGITALNLNGQSQDVIWDSLTINIAADMDSVPNSIQVNFTMTVIYAYDLATCTTYSIKISRNGTSWYTFTNVNVTSFYDTNSDIAYLFTATAVNSEPTYGITVFSTNIETVEWGAGTAAPANSAAPVLTNPDDTDSMYARLRFYLITSNVSDAQGFADIVYVELSLWDNSRSTEIWRIRYNQSTDTFSIVVGSEYIQLSGSSYLKSGLSIDIIWSIKIDWDHQDLSNVDFKQYVVDSSSQFDENWYEVDYDVETKLDYSVAPDLSDDRGDLNTIDLECSGTVVYYGSTLHPLANETDVWVSHDVSGIWPGNLDGLGAFTVSNINSSASVRENTYTIKIVAQGDGSGGSDLYHTPSVTDTFITDRIEFYQSGVESARVNINDIGVVWWSARYEYDSTEITSGLTAQLNGSKSLLWDSGLSRWYYDDVLVSVGRIGYRVVSATESGFGLTGLVQTSSDISIIWDQIVVRSYSTDNTRTNVSDIVAIDVLLEYQYDDSFVSDGTVEINLISAVYQGSGIWRISQARSFVASVVYNTVSCSGNTPDITSVNQNGQSLTIIWDQIVVGSYTVTDNHVTINDVVNIDVTLTFEFDASFVTGGSVTINGISATHLGSGVWRITTTQSSIQAVTYDTVACSGNINGITAVDQNSQSTSVIWDQVVVQSYTVLDSRVNVDDSVNIDFVLHYGYDDSPVLDGTVSLNAIGATHQAAGTWNITVSQSSVLSITYDTVVCSGNEHGISNVDPNGQSVSVIWDEIIVRGYSVDDSRIDLDTSVTINVTLEYAHDSVRVNNGVVIIQSVSATHIGNGIWQISMVKSSVQLVSFDTVVCSGNLHGISSVNQDGQTTSIIWDKVIVRSYSVVDSHVNIDDSVNVDVLLEYEYDDSPILIGSVTINGASASHIGAGVWRIADSQSTSQSVTYDTIACSGNAHGISTIDQNGQSQSVIWDRIIVISYQVLDSRVNLDDTVAIDVALKYEFDNSDVNGGSVLINGTSATYQAGNVWRISVSESIVSVNIYNSVACSGNIHGITTVDQNGQSQSVIWDQITVQSYSSSVPRDDVDSTITVYVTLEYEYDDSDVTTGTVIVNSIPFTYTGSNGVWSADRSQSSVTSETYNTTAASGNTHGITDVNQNGMSTTIIWDRIRILTTTVDDSRLNTDDTARIMVTAKLEYDNHPLGLGDALFLNDSALTWDVSGWFYLDVTQSSVGLWSYFVNTTGALESTYGISTVTVAGLSQDVIWDELSITITADDTSVFDYDTVSFTLDVVYSYDSSPCTTFIVDISRNGTYWLSFTTANVSQFVDDNIDRTYLYSTFNIAGESTFGITVFSTNTETVTWTTPANFAPVNNGDPVLENADDSDNMYAKLKLYIIKSSIVDYDGYADVDYVELSLWDNNRLFEVWRIRFTQATHTFSIEAGSEYIQLSASSTFLEIGSQLNVTWYIKIDWDHFDLQNVDIRQYVQDTSAFSDLDWSESAWDVETRLDYTIQPSLSDDRGDLDTGDLQASGKIVYYGSTFSPLSNETDIWVIHDFSGSWSGSADSSGVISITSIGSSSSVRLNTYTFKIVVAGQGPASDDLYYFISPTDTFITDRIEFYLSGVIDSRININSQGDVWFSARYQYDGVDIQSGLTAYLNGINLLSWDASYSRWHYQEVRASPTEILYQLSSATETDFGITSWVLNAADRSIIWDSLIISITDPVDRRININENATGIIVSAIYSFDSSIFNGTVVLNNTVFQYSSVQRQFYTVSSAFGDPYGITFISVNDMTWCIWDQIEVVSISTNITYMDPTEYVRVRAELRYDFDDSPVENGNFSLKFEDLVHTADGIWEANITRLAYASIVFDTLTICEGTAFGITSFDMYGNVETVYWDRLEFYEASATDSRIDVGSTGFIVWSIRLESAGVTIASGVTAEVSDGSTLTYIDDGWRSIHTSDSVGDMTFSITSASLEGIDFFVSSTNDETIIWDQIRVITTSATSTTPEIETSIYIQVTLIYEYDDTPVTDGVVSLWDEGSQISMTYNVSGGFWYANVTKVEIGNYTFYVSATSGNQYGITVVDLDNIVMTVEYIPAILPRLTPMMIAGISGGFGIILILSAVLVRRRYRVEVPEEIKQIDEALKSMEAGEPVEGLLVRSAQEILYIELEPGLLELGLTVEDIVGVIRPTETEDDTFTADPDAELMDIMDEFKLPGYKQELDEGEIDISILSEEESEAAWSKMLKEVRRIESVEGRKVPLTKEDWIERIPSEIKKIFFEEELRELDIAELEHLAQLTPSELEDIMSSISQTEDMYASLDPEESAAAISSVISDRIESQPVVELDETEKKERLFELLPAFVKEFFSTTWLEKLSSEEIEELLTIPESELRLVIEHIGESRVAVEETAVEVVEEVADEPETEIVTDAVEESKAPTPTDLQAELIEELKSELGEEIGSEPEVEAEAEPEVDLAESATEYDDPRMTEYVKKYGEEKANILITIPESMLEGIPEDQIKEMDLKTTIGLKQALEMEIVEDQVSEDASEVEAIPEPDEEAVEASEDEPVVESEDEPVAKSDEELSNDLMDELNLGFEAESEPEDESDSDE